MSNGTIKEGTQVYITGGSYEGSSGVVFLTYLPRDKWVYVRLDDVGFRKIEREHVNVK